MKGTLLSVTGISKEMDFIFERGKGARLHRMILQHRSESAVVIRIVKRGGVNEIKWCQRGGRHHKWREKPVDLEKPVGVILHQGVASAQRHKECVFSKNHTESTAIGTVHQAS